MSETNTLVIYKLPKQLIEPVTQQLDALKPEGLVRWVQLRFMKRALAVFDSQRSAIAAQPLFLAELRRIEGCEEVEMGFSIGDMIKPQGSHLRLPDPGKLWFVSPPPSPPSEWQGGLEDEPNRRTHYETEFNEQLMNALKEAENSDSSLNSPITPVDSSVKPFRPESPRIITILEAGENKPALKVTSEDE